MPEQYTGHVIAVRSPSVMPEQYTGHAIGVWCPVRYARALMMSSPINRNKHHKLPQKDISQFVVSVAY